MDFNNAKRLVQQLPPDAVVADIGGGASPFPRADYVIDFVSFEERGTGSDGNAHERLGITPRYDASRWIKVDLCDRTPWPFPDKFFDFVTCSHLLEDVRDPIWVCKELNRVAKAGYIEVPSRIKEQALGIEHPCYAGYHHHRWLITKGEGGVLEFRFKPHILHVVDSAITVRVPSWKKFNEAHGILWMEWRDRFESCEVLEFNEEKLTEELTRFATEARKIPDLTVPANRSLRQIVLHWLYYRRLAAGRR